MLGSQLTSQGKSDHVQIVIHAHHIHITSHAQYSAGCDCFIQSNQQNQLTLNEFMKNFQTVPYLRIIIVNM